MFKRKRYIRLFFKALFISTLLLFVTTAIGVYGWFYVNNTISPPKVPNIPIVAIQPNSPLHGSSSSDPSSSNSGTAAHYDLYDELQQPELMQFEERKPNFFTFLLFGLTEGNHANTIMVAAYDADARQGYIISIPRDTRVDFQRSRRKIVNAYPFGFSGGRGHDGGVERMIYEASTLIGFRPDFYISINYEAFISLVDMIGGVEVNVPFHMRYDDPYQNLHINIPAGLQLLDGYNALHFARYRMGNDRRQTISDYQRIEHQQQVLSAVTRELLTPASVLRIPEFINIFNTYVDSNLTVGNLTWLASQARHIGGLDSLHMYTLPMLGTSGAPFWYELADEVGIIELVNRTINPLVRDITSNDLRIAL